MNKAVSSFSILVSVCLVVLCLYLFYWKAPNRLVIDVCENPTKILTTEEYNALEQYIGFREDANEIPHDVQNQLVQAAYSRFTKIDDPYLLMLLVARYTMDGSFSSVVTQGRYLIEERSDKYGYKIANILVTAKPELIYDVVSLNHLTNVDSNLSLTKFAIMHYSSDKLHSNWNAALNLMHREDLPEEYKKILYNKLSIGATADMLAQLRAVRINGVQDPNVGNREKQGDSTSIK